MVDIPLDGMSDLLEFADAVHTIRLASANRDDKHYRLKRTLAASGVGAGVGALVRGKKGAAIGAGGGALAGLIPRSVLEKAERATEKRLKARAARKAATHKKRAKEWEMSSLETIFELACGPNRYEETESLLKSLS